jgi:hypothetical protein
VLLFTVLFAVVVGPWIVAAITGLLSRPGASGDALLVASPSPLYAFVMVDKLSYTSTTAASGAIFAGGVCAAIWAVLGFGFLAAAKRRCDIIIRQHEAALAQTDQLLAQEDEAAAAAAEAAEKSALEAAQEPQGTWTGQGPDAAPEAPAGSQGEP